MNATQIAALLASITVDQVMSAYEGKAGKCYCGCSGDHVYASAHREAAGKDRGYAITDDEVDDERVEDILETVKANFEVEEGCTPGNEPYSIQDKPGGFVTHFTAVVGRRSYTVYLLPKV